MTYLVEYLIKMDLQTDCEFSMHRIAKRFLNINDISREESICVKSGSKVEYCTGKLKKRPADCPMTRVEQ